MNVLTLNVKSNPVMTTARAKADMTRAISLAEVILWQEIEPDTYKSTLKNIGSAWSHANLETEVPISWRNDVWELVHAESHVILDASGKPEHRAHVEGNRYLSIAVLKHRETGVIVVFVNAHFVSGAYSNPGQLGDADGWRLQAWADCQSAIVLHAQPWIDKGYPVVFGGDFNRRRMPKFWTNRQVWLSSTSGYDYLFFVSKSWTVTVHNKQTYSSGWQTDHPAKRAEIFFVSNDPKKPDDPTPVDADNLAAAVAAVETSLGLPDGSSLPLLQRIEALAIHD